ncbi:MAG: hypothetical protein PHF86_09870, partial [Candidatus Nanoarchaeia archaeon]|nr:hypothetical protein [Candidatus Nanoarchaeia archaeon]
GGTNLFFAVISVFTIFLLFTNNLKEKNNLIGYWVYFISFIISIVFLIPGRYYTLNILVTSLTSVGLFFSLIATGVYYLIIYHNIFNLKSKYEHKLPINIISFVITALLGFIVAIVVFPVALFRELNSLVTVLTKPFSVSRWILTVAESHQPYFNPDWVSQMSFLYIILFIIGSILLFYYVVRHFDKHVNKWVIAFGTLIIVAILSRYSSTSILNGDNTLSMALYLGSLFVFLAMIVYTYFNSFYNNKSLFHKFSDINYKYVFVLIWFLLMVIVARTAIRLIFVLIPVTAILVSFFIMSSFNYIKNRKDNYSIWILGLFIIFIVFIVFIPFAKITLAQAGAIGPMYNQQWQYAGEWVRNNTAEGSVFAHWWDYGYLVQTGFERPTITDGGNFIYAWNYFMGRNVLTGHSEQEALDFLYPHNTSYLLMVSDEIGKYPAYSSIGADVNYDRYSWISTFILAKDQVQETRDNINYVYTGGTVLDKDFVYNGILFPKSIAGIAGFIIPITKNSSLEKTVFLQPTAVIVNNNQRYDVPVNCIYANKQFYKFNNANGLDACIMLIPTINQQGQGNQFGALMYISPEVKQSNFARLYLFNQESKNFKLVYNDESSMPLAVLEGRGLIGPIKIWKISYPANIIYNETYIQKELPDPRVMGV